MKSENLHLSQPCSPALHVGTLQRLARTWHAWLRRARERAELAQLDAWSRRDLGLSDGDVWREVSKPCWEA